MRSPHTTDGDAERAANSRSEMPLVSIGIPTRNRARLLQRCIESALGQDYPNLEVVVSDNASTDETPQLCDRWARTNSRLRFARQDFNQGAASNFKIVLQLARGSFFMWLADDDWLDARYVSQCFSRLRPKPDSVLAYGNVVYWRDGRFHHQEPAMDLTASDSKERVSAYFRQVADNGVFYGLIRRSALENLVLPDVLGGDWLLVADILFRGGAEFSPEATLHRSFEGASQSIVHLGRSLARTRLGGFLQSRAPYATIAWFVLRHIGWRSRCFASLGPWARLRLGCRASWSVWSRFGGSPWWKQLRMRIGLRTRIKRLAALLRQ